MRPILSCPLLHPYNTQSVKQGKRILTKEDFEKIVLTPASVETFALDTDFEAGLLLEEVVGSLAQGGQVLGSVVLADPALVFTKGYVQTPVQ